MIAYENLPANQLVQKPFAFNMLPVLYRKDLIKQAGS
jgi:hypothetical protein